MHQEESEVRLVQILRSTLHRDRPSPGGLKWIASQEGVRKSAVTRLCLSEGLLEQTLIDLQAIPNTRLALLVDNESRPGCPIKEAIQLYLMLFSLPQRRLLQCQTPRSSSSHHRHHSGLHVEHGSTDISTNSRLLLPHHRCPRHRPNDIEGQRVKMTT
jgi:hypothetical protein